MRKRSNKEHLLDKQYSRDDQLQYSKLRKHTKKEMAVRHKGGKCQRCNGVFPSCVFDFHHIDPSTKTTRSTDFLCWGWNRILEELNKCIMLCANCHRITHYCKEISS
jgi:hypothetical protein